MVKKRYNSCEIKSAETVISELLGSSQWIKDGMILGAILNVWGELFGEGYLQKARPVEFKNGKLLVRVSDSVMLNDILFYKSSMIDKINSYMKSGVVKDIRFFVK
ncbi:MAG: DUF721 domain-containing protein [Myxococcota bacterium]